MKNQFKKFSDKYANFALGGADKKRIRDNVVAFMKDNPVKSGNHRGPLGVLFGAGYISKYGNFKMVAVSLASFLIFVGGFAYAADVSLPGQALYVVKTGVNEKVLGLFAVSNNAKARLEVKLAEERLVEAEKLSVDNRLDTQLALEISNRFRKHADKANTILATIESKKESNDIYDVSIKYESSLVVHSEILTKLESRDPAVAEIRAEVASHIEGVSRARARVQTAILQSGEADTKVSADKNRLSAESILSDIEQFITRKTANSSSNINSDVSRKFLNAQNIYAEGLVKLREGSYGEAYVLFQQSEEEATEAKSFLIATDELNLNLASDVDEDFTVSATMMMAMPTSTATTSESEESEVFDDVESLIGL